MHSGSSGRLTRRGTLGLLAAGAAGALAGCLGGGDGGDGGDGGGGDGADATTTATGGLGGSGGDGAAGDTSPAGSCASAFGDTDQAYDPGDAGWIATFDYPMGGEVFYEDDTSTGSVASFGYVETELEGNYEQQLSVSQRGPYEDTDPDVGATAIAEQDRYEDGGTIVFDGSERRVAVVRTDDASVIWLIGVVGPDGETYQLQVQAAVASGEPCPETYEALCKRVMRSFEPR